MLLTDGDVFNAREVIDLVRKNASNTRYVSHIHSVSKNTPTLKWHSSKIIRIDCDYIWQKYLKDTLIECVCFILKGEKLIKKANLQQLPSNCLLLT